MKRVLITGITGYIGSHLARAFLPEFEVYGLVREPLRTEYIEDIRDQLHLLAVDGDCGKIAAALREIRPELVYHLAAYYTGTHGDEETPMLIASNITFGACLLEAMAGIGCLPLVYASTVMTHYQGNAYRPLNLYAASKQAFSDLLAYYADAGLVRAVTLTLSDTYGPNDRRPKVLNLILAAAQTGETIALSDGGQDYDVVYIDDVVRAFRSAGEQLLQNQDWTNETFQIYAPASLTLRQTVDRMVQVNALTLNAAWGQRPSGGREIRKAVRFAPVLPGWKAEIPLEEGLKRLMRF